MTPLEGADGLFADSRSSIRLASRAKMNPLDATVGDIHAADIAHSLARQCRYNGHTGGFLSVARHSLWVADYLDHRGESPLVQLVGLMHDAAEAYLGDMVRPLKHGPEIGVAYMAAEARLEVVVFEALGLPYPFPAAVHEADNYVGVELEIGGPQYRWTWLGDYQADQVAFSLRYNQLRREIAQ